MANTRASEARAGYWLVISSRWHIVLVIGVIVVVLTVIWAVIATPIYRAEVVVLPSIPTETPPISSIAGQLRGISAIVGLDLPTGDDPKQEALATLRSRAFAETFIVDHGLLHALFPDNWDESEQAWQIEDPDEIPTLGDAYRKLKNDVLFIQEDYRTGLLTIVVEWVDPNLAAEWANAFVRDFNEMWRIEAIRDAEASQQYLRAELEKTSIVDLRQAIFRLIETQINQVMLANVREEYAFKVIDPAVVSDPDEYVRPNRPLMVGLAIFIGPVLGAILALGLAFAAGLRAERQMATGRGG